ncbi:MAG: hypothetical protein F4121_10770 [Acidimicrobiia bacterium]|nr:hypothetical protein [Acidimicrobiia bacterium]
MRIALHWAFACDVSHRPWAAHNSTLLQHSLSVPAENAARVADARDRLVIPQVVRLVAIAAALRLSAGPSLGTFEYQDDPPPLRTLVDAYFPSLAEAVAPTPAEVRTALWLRSFESSFEDVGGDAVSLMMAQTFGKQSIGEPHDGLARWLYWVSMPDDHPRGTWATKDAPSELRRELRPTGELDLRSVAYLVHTILPFLMESQDTANQLWTIPTLANITHGAQQLDLSGAWKFFGNNLVRQADDTDDLRSLAEAALHLGAPEAEPLILRKAIEQWLIDRPFLRFDDGVIIPIGLPEMVHGVISALETYKGRGETGKTGRQRIGNLLGGCFEAYVMELAHRLDNDHRVLDHTVIDSVIGSAGKRGDLVVADGHGWYVVIEATKRSLRGDIRYGDEEALARWADEHVEKLAQAQSTERSLHEIAAAAHCAPPRESACLVVCDLPLPQTFGLNAIFHRRTGLRHRPFICSISEFEILIELGGAGFSVPSLVAAWQQGQEDIPLGHFLARWPRF